MMTSVAPPFIASIEQVVNTDPQGGRRLRLAASPAGRSNHRQRTRCWLAGTGHGGARAVPVDLGVGVAEVAEAVAVGQAARAAQQPRMLNTRGVSSFND